MENKEIAKPITLVKKELQNGIIDLINQSGLPLFVVGYVMRDITNQLNQQIAQQELMEEQEYKKALDEANRKDDANE